jgi:DNA-binding response OmpR family regulator
VAALESGGVDYVTKPIKPKEVLARMQVHLQGRARAPPDPQRAGRLWLRHHHGARQRRLPDVANPTGA